MQKIGRNQPSNLSLCIGVDGASLIASLTMSVLMSDDWIVEIGDQRNFSRGQSATKSKKKKIFEKIRGWTQTVHALCYDITGARSNLTPFDFATLVAIARPCRFWHDVIRPGFNILRLRRTEDCGPRYAGDGSFLYRSAGGRPALCFNHQKAGIYGREYPALRQCRTVCPARSPFGYLALLHGR